MAHYYPHVPLAEIDEQQMDAYLQHVPALTKMQSQGIANLLATMLGK